MLVISPFSRGGHIASETFDHTSQLRFVEERFGVKAPNLSAWRRSAVGDLDLDTPSRSEGRECARQLPPTTNDPGYLASKGCTTNDLLEIATDQPPYPLPKMQQMPSQETR